MAISIGAVASLSDEPQQLYLATENRILYYRQIEGSSYLVVITDTNTDTALLLPVLEDCIVVMRKGWCNRNEGFPLLFR